MALDPHIRPDGERRQSKPNKRCLICPELFYASPHKIKKGQAKYCSMKCYGLGTVGRPKAHRGRPLSKVHREKLSGRNANNWQGGITNKNELLRKRIEYRLWRIAVFERDSYTCQICNKRGGKLNADHIKPFALYPEVRYAIDNGRTLCESCHKQTDTWGGRIFKWHN